MLLIYLLIYCSSLLECKHYVGLYKRYSQQVEEYQAHSGYSVNIYCLNGEVNSFPHSYNKVLFANVQLLESICRHRLNSSYRTEYNWCRFWYYWSWYCKSNHHRRLHLYSVSYDPDTVLSVYIYKLMYPSLWTTCTIIILIL